MGGEQPAIITSVNNHKSVNNIDKTIKKTKLPYHNILITKRNISSSLIIQHFTIQPALQRKQECQNT